MNNSAQAMSETNEITPGEGVGRESTIYRNRFSAQEELTRELTWQVLVERFFNRYLTRAEVVVDVGAGDGHFIRNVRARRRVAVDLSAHVQDLQRLGIEVLQTGATEFASKLTEPADIVFMSNFLEHLPSKRMVLDVLEESRRALKDGGLILVLQPNVRYVGAEYWDYIDHQIALTEYSLGEALEIAGFELVDMIPRFLPYTARSFLGRLTGGKRAGTFVWWYLRLPFLWRVFGAQTFVAARRK